MPSSGRTNQTLNTAINRKHISRYKTFAPRTSAIAEKPRVVLHHIGNRQTDRQTLYCVDTALCIASHGKKKLLYHEVDFMICRPVGLHIIHMYEWYVGCGWIVDEIVKRLSIAAQWRHRLGNKENRGFYELHLTPPVFYPNFESVSVAPDRSCCGQWEQDLKLFGRAIIFEAFQLVWKSHRRTDDMQSHNRVLRSIAR